MKKILSAFLAMVMVFTIVPISISADTSGYYTYTVSNGEATITKVSTSISGAVTIPDTLGGYPVTAIGTEAFYWCRNLTSVTIPDSVTSIGSLAFYYCTKLTSVTIPDSMTNIDAGAFYECDSPTSVTIPDSVTSISSSAFSGCDNLTITCYENSYAHTYAKNNGIPVELLKKPTAESYFTYTVSDGEATITDFYSTYAGEVIIPDTLGGYPVTAIGSDAFHECYSLTSITIPDSVTSIGSYAFFYCASLTSVTIPDSVTSIGNSAFYGCTSLTSVTIPDSVTSIGYRAFYNCYNLTITCYKNSYAHTYAKNNGIPYEIICNHTSTKLDGAVSPTCISDGYTGDTVCADCDELIEKGSTIPATGHDTVQHEGKAPTCTESGYADYVTCNTCDYTTYEALPANGHSIVKHSAKSATCTEIGWFAYETCEHCDYTTYVEIRPQGHYFEGSTCKYCGEPKPVLPGDVNGNGAIDITDLSAFRRYIGGATIDGFIEAAADVDGDGEVKISDVSALARMIAGAVIQ